MKANAVPLLGLFERKWRLEVPLFQRQYVWSREQQWEPLWEDIARKFTEYLEGRKDSPVHFLGAMVLDQKMTPSTHVEKRQVIDGQQRLTTLQIVLAALRDFCREYELADHAREFESHTLNKGMMADPEVDRFKVWPTRLDREHFVDVLSLGSREAIEAKHPLTKRKWARTYDPRPRIIEAYLYFDDQIREFFLGTEDEPPLCAEQPLELRVDEAFQALKNALQVVAIDLEQGDDAQVIFETLTPAASRCCPPTCSATTSSSGPRGSANLRNRCTRSTGARSTTSSGGRKSGRADSSDHAATSSCSTSSPAARWWTSPSSTCSWSIGTGWRRTSLSTRWKRSSQHCRCRAGTSDGSSSRRKAIRSSGWRRSWKTSTFARHTRSCSTCWTRSSTRRRGLA